VRVKSKYIKIDIHSFSTSFGSLYRGEGVRKKETKTKDEMNDAENPKPTRGVCAICNLAIERDEHSFGKFFVCLKCITQEKMHVWCYFRTIANEPGNQGLACLNSEKERHYLSPNNSLWALNITNIPPFGSENDPLASAITYRESLQRVDALHTRRPDPFMRFVRTLIMFPVGIVVATVFVLLRIAYGEDPRLIDRIYWCLSGACIILGAIFVWKNARTSGAEKKQFDALDEYSSPPHADTKLGSRFVLYMEAAMACTSMAIPVLARFGSAFVLLGVSGAWLVEFVIVAYGCGKDVQNFLHGARRYAARRKVLWFLYRRAMRQVAASLGADIDGLERSRWTNSEVIVDVPDSTKLPKNERPKSALERLAEGLHEEMKEMARIDSNRVPKLCGVSIAGTLLSKSWDLPK
jgi:hypothetical protein